MTENKRFNYVLGDGFTDYMMHLTATEVCDLLNELYDENKKLKEKLLKVIDTSNENHPNKKGFIGNGRFA